MEENENDIIYIYIYIYIEYVTYPKDENYIPNLSINLLPMNY